MKTPFPKIRPTLPFLVALLLGAMVTPVFAGRHGHHHRSSRSYHSGYYSSRSYYRAPRVSVGIYSSPYYASPYYRSYYRPYYAPYYAPAPVVYGRPVTVVRPVTVQSAAPSTYEVQRELARLGYYGGALDGAMGPRTRAAIRTYQVDRGLPVTGRVDGNLLRSLRLL
ncbi:MAG TPA: peptidoglycan-binding domain-containing protein [Chthoniobacteraceae bacterium]|nr:peptidoglycan-binding domain-containing protein [Chthoniobacteraceae bacterium]